MKLFEATVRVNGKEFTDRVGANDAQEARLLLQQRHGPRAVPYVLGTVLQLGCASHSNYLLGYDRNHNYLFSFVQRLDS